MKLFVTFATLVGFVSAGCPNGCSGHGSCGTSDVCHCYKGFHGGDCSFRHCPVGPSWTVTPIAELVDDRYSEKITLNTPGGYMMAGRFDSNDANYENVDFDRAFRQAFVLLYPKRPNFNQYTECSSRGTCDYATGECKCFDGFEGRGCRRTTCPGGCSGHGRCLDNWDMNGQYSSWNYPNDQMWDQKRTQSCQCDRGFTGYDCNTRICPFGDDPTSDCGENSAGDVQLVITQSPLLGFSYFTLTFTDMFNGKFTTRPIEDHAKSCAWLNTAGDGFVVNEAQDPIPEFGTACPELQYALMDLPNFAIPEVEVNFVEGKLSGNDPNIVETTYAVYFTDSSNAGKQNTLECNLVDSNDVAGAQPKYATVTDCNVYNIGGPEWFAASGKELTLDVSGGNLAEWTTIARTTVLAGFADAAVTYEDFQPCASKGDCDGATGTCVCNAGHFGEACEKQSTYY